MRSAISSIGVAGLVLAISFLSSCVKRPFVPVNEGREYGNPTTPWLVSHVPKANQWALARTDHHNVFQKILCFSYPCRKMIGRRKALHAISFEDYRKRIRKNAKKGVYKKKTPAAEKPAPVKTPTDSVFTLPKDTVTIAQQSVAAVAEAPILKADSLITLNEFLFEINSSKLEPEHFPELNSLSQFLLAHPILEVSVSGHTDNTGNERHNVTLSTRRAEAVAEYLISKGVDDGKVFFEGFGSARPLMGNETPEGRGKNRRVEILIKNPKK
jgi:outer membrane protein OmpA-like peptidoglycan-associated protein